MKIAAFFSSTTTEGPLSAFEVYDKYFGITDPNGNMNTVELYDIKGVLTGTIDTLIAGLTATTYHRIWNLCTVTIAGTGVLSAAQVTALEALLITKAVDPLSDTKVISIAPASFPFTLTGGNNQAQNVWNALFSFIKFPLIQGTATAGGAGTLTDTGLSMTVNKYSGLYLTIISGTGVSNTVQIASNTATQFTFTSTLTAAANSVYQITTYPPKGYAQVVGMTGNQNFPMLSDQATAGGAATITATQTMVASAYKGCWILIYRGPGAGQFAQITDNTTSVITVVSNWVTQPTSSSYFIIVSQENELFTVHAYQKFLWAYCTKISTSANVINQAVVKILMKLIDNNRAINSPMALQEVSANVPVDTWYTQHVVIPSGKAMFDIGVAGASPIYPK